MSQKRIVGRNGSVVTDAQKVWGTRRTPVSKNENVGGIMEDVKEGEKGQNVGHENCVKELV